MPSRSFSAATALATPAALASRSRQAQQRRHPLVLLADRRLVEAQHRRQIDRVQRAVMQAIALQPARRMAERMHRAQALLEDHRAFHRRHRHVVARLAVRAVPRRALDVRPGLLQPIERDAVGRRVEGVRQEAFDVVREGVHARAGGEMRRQAHGQLGIDQRQLGDQVRAADRELAAGVHDDHAAAAHLAAGARGRRDGDDRRDRRA